MENTSVFRILILCVTVLAVTSESSIRLETDATEVQKGDTFSFTCVAKDLVGGTSFLRLQKVPVGVEDAAPLILTTNAIKANEIKDNERFSVAYQPGDNPGELKFIFTITDAKHADSGEYYCMIMGGEGVITQDKKEIVVLNVQDFMVEMTVARPGQEIMTISSDGDTVPEIELEEAESFHITIKTSETHPAPLLTVKVGTQNIDDQFSMETVSTEYNEENGLLVGVKSSVTAEGDVTVDHSYKDGCCAEATAPGQPALKACFKVKFSGFPPMINNSCARSIIAGNHEKNIKFECSVTSEEPIEVYYIYTRTLEDNATETEKILLGMANQDYHYVTSLNEDRDNMMYNVEFLMPVVYPQMFKEYTMVVSNSQGNSSHTFSLEHGVRAELAIKVDVSKEQASIGDDVQIRCHITNEERKTFYVVWVKKVGKNEVEVGTNTKMNQLFEQTGRYSGDVEFKDGQDIADVTFILNIKNVDSRDTAEIGCKLPQLEMFVFEQLTVEVPFESLMMTSRHLDGTHEVSYQSGDTVKFDEGEKRAFTCRATGGNPQPEMVITLGDKDISSEFNKSVKQRTEGTPGLYDVKYDIELKNPALEITFEYSKKKLECKATIPKTNFVNSTSVDIQLSGYKPQFLCEEIVEVPLHKEDFNITCRVRADPPINGSLTEYFWERTATVNDTILPGDSIGQFTAFQEPGKDPYEHLMTLHIDHVYMNHFQTYFFQASNVIGSNTHSIEVRRAPNYVLDTEAPTGGNTDKQVPGKKDNPNSAGTLGHLLPGVVFMVVLMVTLL